MRVQLLNFQKYDQNHVQSNQGGFFAQMLLPLFLILKTYRDASI